MTAKGAYVSDAIGKRVAILLSNVEGILDGSISASRHQEILRRDVWLAKVVLIDLRVLIVKPS